MKINLKPKQINVNKRMIFEKCDFAEFGDDFCVYGFSCYELCAWNRFFNRGSFDAFHFDVVLKPKKSDSEENVLFCIWIDWTAWLQSALTLWSKERQIIFKRSNDQHKTKFEYILTGTYTQPSYTNLHTFKKLLWFFSNDKNYRESVEKWHYNRFGLCSMQLNKCKQVEWK